MSIPAIANFKEAPTGHVEMVRGKDGVSLTLLCKIDSARVMAIDIPRYDPEGSMYGGVIYHSPSTCPEGEERVVVATEKQRIWYPFGELSKYTSLIEIFVKSQLSEGIRTCAVTFHKV